MDDKNVRKRKNINSAPKKDHEKRLHRSDSQPATNSFLVSLLITSMVMVGLGLFGYFNSPITAVYVGDVVGAPLKDRFEVNEKLAKGKKILNIDAPECIVEDNSGNLLMGLNDGRIIKIFPSNDGILGEGKIANLTNGILEGAEKTDDNMKHGRPLGMRLRGHSLYFMDAIYGLCLLDLTTKEVKVLVKPSDVNPPMKFPDDLDISKDGRTVYFSDASSLFPITKLAYSGIEGSCIARILTYDLVTEKLKVVVSGLCFANGVQLTQDEKMLIVPETIKYRINWFDTKSWKKKHILHVPAMPDNIRLNRRGNYWVGGTSVFTSTVRALYTVPTIRQMIFGLLPESLIFKFVNRKHNFLFEVNSSGEILQTLHDTTGAITYAVAQGTDLSDGRIALGTYAAPYLTIVENPDQ